MGEHDQDQDDVAEPARPPLTAARARGAVAYGLRGQAGTHQRAQPSARW
ncbi:hypothetical protein O1M63_18545 [Streptomyces mirabilis]|nr:hypothetical protein [Streptomyces mirabilis]